MAKRETNDIELIRTWTLSAAVTMGSSVRAKGLLQEIQARLPASSKKAISLEGVDLVLAMPADERPAFNAAASVVSTTLEEAPSLPVIPREIQDILGMKTSERHRWLADGRLPSAGTRTVRLAGRARQITFHVFDPKVVEDLLDRGAVDEWRVEDAEAKAEKRAKAAYQRKVARLSKKTKRSKKWEGGAEDPASSLRGWEDFDLDGLLR
ncbi:Mlr2029 protein [Neorhizobium galegae bv. officinalis]|nr:Mlr2029 protein [Neorhizobium galegae bv. officinalis]